MLVIMADAVGSVLAILDLLGNTELLISDHLDMIDAACIEGEY